MIQKTFGAIGLLAIVCILAAFALAPRRGLTASILIAAPPGKIWAILTDLPAYPEWNRELTLTGRLIPGGTVQNTIDPNTPEQMIFYPIILTATPGRELRWEGHIPLYGRIYLPRVFDATHDFLLTPAPGGATVFTQSETCSGILLWLFDINQLRPGFIAMNAALKTRAEAR